MKDSFRIVGFDCAEDEHCAVLLDADGDFEKRVEVINERGQIQDLLAELMLATGPDGGLLVNEFLQSVKAISWANRCRCRGGAWM